MDPKEGDRKHPAESGTQTMLKALAEPSPRTPDCCLHRLEDRPTWITGALGPHLLLLLYYLVLEVQKFLLLICISFS